ncbi:vesicular acetylcholine transporter-like isoform X2 [Ruditapes philippinarum]|uniref:vesicular acetylcholine transporter-like isoform X2 n=1 Tax=Ruditapes philippinarum TaxID=129788 RepID=UPI00295C21D9|nr:vesicular acetylcholine transporter-like isoform X2 [Ruditapes philippinarum]
MNYKLVEIRDKVAEWFANKVNDPIHQRRLVLVIVCIALLLDNMLYMVIVPIIPEYLTNLRQQDQDTVSNQQQINWTAYNLTYFNSTMYPLNYTGSTPAPPQHRHWNKTWKKIFLIDVPAPPVNYGNEGQLSIGVLFASKAILQLLVNPFTGAFIDRVGYDLPMMIGLSIMFMSTTVFAFGKSYGVLFFARSLQGIGSAFADTSGLAMIADRFHEEGERNKALGIALAFISFGCLFAPPFGGILYEFCGKVVPFLLLAFLCVVDGLLVLFVMKPVRKQRSLIPPEDRPKGTPIWRLLMDPYILVAAGALAMSNVSLAFLEPTIAMWMNHTMGADEWEVGFVWLPAFIPHILGVYLTVKWAKLFPKHQWLVAALGLALEGTSCLIIPCAKAYFVVLFPLATLCFGIACVDTALLPILGYLVDVRYVSVYGSVYAIADISYSFAYAFGPIVAGQLVDSIGFTWLNVLIFITNVGYAPLLICMKTIYKYKPFEDENECDVLVSDPPTKQYMTIVQNGGPFGDGTKSIDVIGKNHLELSPRNKKNYEIDSYPPENNFYDSDTDYTKIDGYGY